MPEIDNSIGGAKQVNYVKSWPVAATPTELADHWLGIETIHFATRAGDALYLKGDDYSHEQEWRVIDKPKPGTQADHEGVYRVHIDTREVVEIIIGSRVSNKNASRIMSLCSERFPSVQVR